MRLRKAWLACALLFAAAGCEKRTVSEEAKQEQAETQALKASAGHSWLVDLARDSQPLVALAEESDGWRALFMGNAQKALKSFEYSLRKHPTDEAVLFDLQVGAARAALEIAQACEALFELTQNIEPQWKSAILTASDSRAFQLTRVRTRQVALGMQVRQYAERAAHHLSNVAPARQPVVAVLCAEASALVQAHGGASSQCALTELIAQPPAQMPLSVEVLSEHLQASDLVVAAKAWQGQPLAAQSLSERVWQAWQAHRQGREVDLEAFPGDRGSVQHALDDAIGALGEAGLGAQDVLNLELSARSVDGIERRFADAVVDREPALAVKLREDAEDKGAAAAPSPRNTLSSLAKSARDNVAIGRYRVSLKYLSRLGLSAAELPSDLLRDLLTLRAMEADDPAMIGQ